MKISANSASFAYAHVGKSTDHTVSTDIIYNNGVSAAAATITVLNTNIIPRVRISAYSDIYFSEVVLEDPAYTYFVEVAYFNTDNSVSSTN